MKIVIKLLLFFIAPIFLSTTYTQALTDEAEDIYGLAHRHVVQVQVIDLATGKKTSIGSGFQFTPDGHIATNFHVVAEAVQAPKRFRVEYILHDSRVGRADILDVDVVHDLAIIHSRELPKTHLVLGHSDMARGAYIFSMGNPFDLGMSIVEGIYNGPMEDSLYRKILFSGSLNPGMSGGPALDREGKVIGINVATAGNEISFLVPVEHLEKLYAHVSTAPLAAAWNWQEYIREQLTQNQDQYMKRLLDTPWESFEVGEANVPGEILSIFKCWGKSEDKESELYHYAHINCSTSDDIFLSPGFSTGRILYQYVWVKSKGLNSFRFYNLYERYFKFSNPYQNAGEDDVTNFQCKNNFVNVGGRDAKVLWCTRQYKKFPNLYDINLALASTDRFDRGLLVEVVALGLGTANANNFVRKFMNAIQWQNLLSK